MKILTQTKRLQEIKKLFSISLLCIATACVLSVSGCSGSTTSGVNPPTNNAKLTIDNAGTIPAFANTATTTVVYVHNNSTENISGIKYSFKENNSKGNASHAIIDGSKCTTLPANSSCPIMIKTPIVDSNNTQGSVSITADYSLSGKSISFTQVINYELVNNSQTKGAVVQSGVTLAGYGNSTAYGTIYVYGSGTNQIYDISSISINKPSVKITNGNITGQQIQSNYVQAIEVSSQVPSTQIISALLKVNSQLSTGNNLNKSYKILKDGDGNFSSTGTIGVAPSDAGAILTTSVVPLINTALTTSGEMVIQNSGNAPATITTVTPDNGITITNDCSGTLDPADTCNITFNVTPAGGSGNITVDYTGASSDASVAGNVTWFNGVGAPLVSITITDNPLNFSATTSGSTTVTMTNIGGYQLSNVSIPDPIVLTGNATASISDNTCGGDLAINDSCSYTITLNDNNTDSDSQVNLGFSANYNTSQVYSRVAPLAYNSLANGAIISLTPESMALTIVGNRIESQVQYFTISNDGNQPANLTLVGLSSGAPDFLNVITNTDTPCGAILNDSSTCTIGITLGPVLSEEGQSGTNSYSVDFTATGQTPSGSVSGDINWTVQGYALNLSLIDVSSNLSSGDGNSDDPYILYGDDASGKQITLTYKNTGTDPVKITGIQDSNIPLAWLINSSCTLNTTLAVGDECTIQYGNQLLTNNAALVGLGSTYSMPLVVPTLVFQDANDSTNQFSAQPQLPNDGGTTIYALSNQATIANSIILDNPATDSQTVTVTNLLANAYSGNTVVTTIMEDYFTASIPYANCTQSSENGIRTQRCTLNSGNPSGSVVYGVNNSLIGSESLTLTALFSAPNTAIYVMNAIQSSVDLLPELNKLIFVTTNTYRGGYILQDANASSPAPSPLLTSGLEAGDYLCNLQAATNTAMYPGSYKALLAGDDRVPGGNDWVLQANKIYRNQLNHTIGTTDIDAKLPALLDNSIGVDDNKVWSGFNDNWGVAGNNNCGTWASGNSGNGTYGIVSALTYFSEYGSGYLYTDQGGELDPLNCYSLGNASHLYCVQQ